MRALVTTLKFLEITPSTRAQVEVLASNMAAIDGLLSTCWLRGSGQISLVQTFESSAAVDAYLDGPRFAALGRLPGCQDVFAVHYDVATQLNDLSAFGVPVAEREHVLV
ncbi:MAG TPA: hypothetical protein VKZ96_18785 [Thermomicrobiales bacterium]|nr:hypothetical protein [Thermomicrobiales bacterium]